jgi:glucan phosphoethanolaminetransferase (alkaline phosphatase superfamily)
MTTIRSKTRSFFSPIKALACSPLSLVLITTVIAALYVMLEWVFIFTRPSFLRTVSLIEKSRAFLSTSGLLVLASLLALVPFLLLVAWIKNPTLKRVFQTLALLVPSLMLTAALLLFVDNFTYTLFRFGIVSTAGVWRAIYAALSLLVLVFLLTRLADLANLLTLFIKRSNPRARVLLPLGIVLLSTISAILPANLTRLQNELQQQRTSASRNQMPDILLITVDALNAEYTSIYGGENDTSPFLRELAGQSLVSENHFANAQGTIGSLTSLLSGKHPADIRVIYSSDMLQATDAYQHLPGILNAYGYYTVQLSNATYADAYKTNFQSAFDEANGRSDNDRSLANALNKIYPGVSAIFQNEAIDRITTRVQHIFFIRDMNNPYKEVTEAPQKFDDLEKIKQVKSLLNVRREPVFIHLHWMGTHGPNYFPEEQVFSQGLDLNDQEQNRQFFYYDAILEFDRTIADLYQFLETEDHLDHTVVIITSDHSQKWTNSRLPLVIHFPGDENHQVISANTENIDLAPTLLDYLGISQPAWMPGQSLISGSYSEHPIFTAKIPKSSKDPVTGKVTYPESEPPFYQFGRISVVVCNQWVELDLTEKTISSGKIVAYTRECDDELNEVQALDLIIGHLESYGFDTATLRSLKAQQSELLPTP